MSTSARQGRASRHRHVDVTTLTVQSIVKLVYDKEARDEVSGVVGSYEATRQTFEFNTVRAISILALISLSLGIINLFPFLPLDGGHIFWALAEKVRGRAISSASWSARRSSDSCSCCCSSTSACRTTSGD